MWSMSGGVMYFCVSHQSQCGLYQRTNQIVCQKIRWYLHWSGDMSVYCTLFSQTFYGLLFSYLTITDVTLYLQIIDFQFASCCTSQPKKLNQIITVNSSTNTAITKKITLARFACLCFITWQAGSICVLNTIFEHCVEPSKSAIWLNQTFNVSFFSFGELVLSCCAVLKV